MFCKGDAQLTKLVNYTSRQTAEYRVIKRRYNRWFLRKLPTAFRLDLPRSAQLDHYADDGARSAGCCGCG